MNAHRTIDPTIEGCWVNNEVQDVEHRQGHTLTLWRAQLIDWAPTLAYQWVCDCGASGSELAHLTSTAATRAWRQHVRRVTKSSPREVTR